jgi:hypothetical protein
VTIEDVANYVPEEEDKRSEQDWLAMSLEDLRAEWERGPRFEKPPYPVDQNRYRRLTRVRSEIYARTNGKAPDGVTYGKGKA